MPEWRDVVAEVQKWVDAKMKAYVARATRSTTARQFSIINDNLWGSIRVSELERSLIDSPVMQRLRLIRQLGAACLVYPSAVHSRFDHSLGALFRASMIMDVVVEASSSRPADSLLSPAAELSEWTPAVRVGALLHDVGHVFLSHAGERALTESRLPGFDMNVEPMLDQASRDLNCEKGMALAELFSFAIVNSNSIRDLCRKFDEDVAKRLPVVAASLVHSRKEVQAQQRWIIDVLSGPLDVDKQDYVPRDSLMAGVGVQVEPHRCAEVLRVCDLKDARVVNDTKIKFTADERRLVITFSGIFVVEDMLLSRMSLTLRVYRHHKVRLAERIAQRAYDFAKREHLLSVVLDGDETIGGVLDLTDAAFFAGEVRRRLQREISQRERRLAELDPKSMDRRPDEADAAKKEAAQLQKELQSRRILTRLFEYLENRRLPVRAFAYGARFAQADGEVPLGANRVGTKAWAELLEAMMDPARQRAIEARIIDVTKELLKLLGETIDEESSVLLESSIYADIAPVKPVDLSPLFVYSHVHERELVAYDKLFQPGQWLDALRDSKLICYVYAPKAYAHYVNVAAELVLADQFGALSRNLRDAYSRTSRTDVDRIKERLFKTYERGIENREDPPVRGLWTVLTPPSFLSPSDEQTLEAFFRDSFQRKERLLRDHPAKVAAFYKLAIATNSELFAVHIDLIGSSKVVAKLKDSVPEGDSRLAMLDALQRHLLTAVGNADAKLLPLKTEGDAVLCVAACSPSDVKPLVTAVRELIFGEGWKLAIEKVAGAAGWTLDEIPLPRLRASVGRGAVQWREELHDVLGEPVTAIFVLEAEIKEKGGDGPMIAWLGNWEGVFEGEVKEVEFDHKKVGKMRGYLDRAAAK